MCPDMRLGHSVSRRSVQKQGCRQSPASSRLIAAVDARSLACPGGGSVQEQDGPEAALVVDTPKSFRCASCAPCSSELRTEWRDVNNAQFMFRSTNRLLAQNDQPKK